MRAYGNIRIGARRGSTNDSREAQDHLHLPRAGRRSRAVAFVRPDFGFIKSMLASGTDRAADAQPFSGAPDESRFGLRIGPCSI